MTLFNQKSYIGSLKLWGVKYCPEGHSSGEILMYTILLFVQNYHLHQVNIQIKIQSF